MDQSSKNFLINLLNTPTPSGSEERGQHLWLDFVTPFADQISTDCAGNAFAILNPKAPFKILLAGHCDEIALMVRGIDQNGFIYFSSVGGISERIAPGMRVSILGKQTIKGVIGVNTQHHGGLPEKIKFSDLHIDCGAKTKEELNDIITPGDFIVYDVAFTELLNNRFTARGLDNRTGSFITAEVIKRLSTKKLNVSVIAASTVNEETNMGGAFFASAKYNPTMAIILDVTFATDYPGVDTKTHGEYKLEGGPVLAKGAPINKKINELLISSATRLKINLQYELTPGSTGTDGDKTRLTNQGVPIALVSLPIRYMHAPVETASYKDLEEEIELLVETISNMTGSEELLPIKI